MWENIKVFFKKSETIFVARLNAFVGFLATMLSYADPSLVQAVLTPQNFAWYMLINGIIIEIARRMRAPDLGK